MSKLVKPKQIDPSSINGYVLTTSGGTVMWAQSTTVTGFTYTPNQLTISKNNGINYSVGINNFTGLTVNGSFSATTYLGLPTDVRVTGFTYVANQLTISQNNGTNLSVGINNFTGLTVNGSFSATTYLGLPTDIRVTGFTYTPNQLTISQNNGTNLSVGINNFTGLTINGSLAVTSAITTNTFSVTNNPVAGYVLTSDASGNAIWLPVNTPTTGGDTGRIYFLAPSVASDIGGYSLATTNPTLGTGTTIVQANTGTGDNLIGSFATIVGEPAVTSLPVGIALRTIHGNVANNPEIGRYKLELYQRSTGGTETLLRSGYSDPFGNISIDEITWTFVALSATTLNITDRLVFKLYTARVSGPTTVTVSSYFENQNPSFIRTTTPNPSTDTYTTGFTYNNANILTISRNQSQPNLNVTISNFTGLTVNGSFSATTYLGLPTDLFVTGGTYSNGIITLRKQTGTPVTITGLMSADTFVTGFTYAPNQLTISRNLGLPNLSVGINNFTGLTVNGSFSATTYLGLPASGTFTGNTSATCITNLYISNLFACSPTSPITVFNNFQRNTSTAPGLYSNVFSKTSTVASTYSTISGGRKNTISGSTSSIGGGYYNTINATQSFIGGGYNNTIPTSTVTQSVIGGGTNNIVNSTASFIGGGSGSNIAIDSQYNAIVGGASNQISGSSRSFIGGGQLNLISTGTKNVLGGGYLNKVHGTYSTIGGGQSNIISTSDNSTIAGGRNNSIIKTATYSTIGGGTDNRIDTITNSTISGGKNNTITGATSFIGGGAFNISTGLYSIVVAGNRNSSTATYSCIIGGSGNTVSANLSFIGSGRQNTLSGNNGFIGVGLVNTISSNRSFIGSGRENTLSVGAYTSIVNGKSNSVSGSYSGILGGTGNTISGINSFIIGGKNNVISGSTAFIGGGARNRIDSNTEFSSIQAGSGNTVTVSNTHVIGSSISATTANYTYVENLNIVRTPTTAASGSTTDQILIRSTDGTIKVADAGAPQIYSARVTITSGSVLTIFTTPIQIVPAPASTHYIKIIAATAKIIYNGVAYTNNPQLVLINSTAGQSQYVSPTLFLQGTTAQTKSLFSATANVVAETGLIAGKALNVSTAVGNPSAGNSAISVIVHYMLVPDF
jgi:hypothetical protein